MVDMLCYGCPTFTEKDSHLLLSEPYCVIFQFHVKTDTPVIGLVNDNLTFVLLVFHNL